LGFSQGEFFLVRIIFSVQIIFTSVAKTFLKMVLSAGQLAVLNAMGLISGGSKTQITVT
jgi:hypothetical protein